MITAIIEKAQDGGFSIYSPQIKGVYAPGPTEEEAKEEFAEMLAEEAEDVKERTGSYPEWHGQDAEIEFTYSISGFFEAFPFINASEFAKAVGVNPSLMRRYKAGKSGVSPRQRQQIQQKLYEIAGRLQAVRF